MAEASNRLPDLDGRDLAGLRRRTRSRVLGSALPIVGIWIAAAAAFSQITGRVTDWYVMTDELVYERLAISVARTGSPLPQIHGSFVRSLDQLYPWLIAPLFVHGSVWHDLHQAHLLGAWVMSSACIPAFLLARRVTGRPWAAYLIGVVSICLPWMIYASFLLTEVVAYPAFLWAMLAIQAATASPSRRNDLLALLSLVLVFLARTELAVLVVVLPLTLLAHELALTQRSSPARRARAAGRAAVRAHPLLAALYGALAVGVVVFVAAGGKLADLTVYGQEIQGGVIPHGIVGASLGHLAQLAFGIGILPFVVGAAWLTANLVRPAETVERQAFACLGSVAIPLVTVEVAKYDLGIGPVIYDRYLFYLVPVVLIGFLCALLDRQAPRWSLALPTALVCLGFALRFQDPGAWSILNGPVDADSPVSIFYKPIVEANGSIAAAQAFLVLATILLAAAFGLIAARARSRFRLAALFAMLLAVLLPLESGIVFARLLSSSDNAYRPLTGSGNATAALGWVDKAVGPRAQVTMIPYHVSTDYLGTQVYWWDLEFWNKSVVRDAEYPSTGEYSYTGIWFPKDSLGVDPATGSVSGPDTPYVVQSLTESRFGIAGNILTENEDAILIRAARPWRLAWLSYGAYDDGWMKAGVPVHIRVYPLPGQRGPTTLDLSLQFWAPDGVSARPVEVISNLQRYHGTVTSPTTTFATGVEVCVPARGYADVVVRARGSSPIPGDLSIGNGSSQAVRLGSVYIADTAVSNENIGGCTPIHG